MPAPERTSTAAIVAAGQDLLEDGPARLTMQAVAERVGVRAPSLYKRVRDRDALLDLVAEATLEELGRDLASAEPSVAGLAGAYRAFAHRRPEGFRLVVGPRAALEARVRISAPVLRVAEELVGPTQALEAARLVTAWATGFVTMELAGAFRLGGDLERAFAFGVDRLSAALALPLDPTGPPV